MIKGVISDVDGTLVDSNDYHAAAWQEAFRESGVETSQEAVREQIGKGGDQLIPCFLTPEQISSFGNKVDRRKNEIFKGKYLDRVKGLPGVQSFLERLYRDKKKAVLATSGGKEEMEHYTRLLGIEKWIAGMVSSEDVARSKPYPDLFHAALDRSGWKPEEAAVLGDTPYDAEAGSRAGLKTIAVLTGGFPERSLRNAGAVEVYTDLPSLLKNYQTSCLSEK